MSNITQNELLDYLKNAIDLETDVATQEQIITTYKQKAEEDKPKVVTLEKPKAPIHNNENPSGTGLFVLGIVFFLFGLIPALLVPGDSEFRIILALIGVGLLMWCCYEGMKEKTKYDEVEQQYNSMREKYETQLASVQKANKESLENYQNHIGPWTHSNEQMLAVLNGPITDTKEVLSRFYSKEVIYAKYRNLPALTSIYEYFVTGRCTELTGPHGAYNLYEDELRKDTVISQLNTVIENLEQIKQNQYMLYQQVKAIQENTNSIASELRQIKGYTVQIAQLTALNAYYAALNERNTRITMYYHL